LNYLRLRKRKLFFWIAPEANKKGGFKRFNFKAHDGPIWQVAWAEPGCGNLLASCSYDKTIKIWSEQNLVLTSLHTLNKYDWSVNCIGWAPAEYGIILIAGLSNGKIIVITYAPNENEWEQKVVDAHASSVNAISINHESIKSWNKNPEEENKLKFVSCSCDNQVYEWVQEGNEFKRYLYLYNT